MMNSMKAAPEFSLPDQDGQKHSLKDYLGKWVVVYFYPKDDTPGCTKEACLFRDGREDMEQLDITVLGISADSVDSHRRFANKYNLNFTLLSDESKDVIKAYGANGLLGTSRKTFIVNPQGQIAKQYDNVQPAEHADQIMADMKVLQNAA